MVWTKGRLYRGGSTPASSLKSDVSVWYEWRADCTEVAVLQPPALSLMYLYGMNGDMEIIKDDVVPDTTGSGIILIKLKQFDQYLQFHSRGKSQCFR